MYDFKNFDRYDGRSNPTLPTEAMTFNGKLFEHEIEGYRTLQVAGREILANDLSTQVVGQQDGDDLQSKRHPSRDIKVLYQLDAESPLAFRKAFYRLNLLLHGSGVQFSFGDDPSVYWLGTLSEVEDVPGGTDHVKATFTIHCSDPYAHAVDEKRFPLDSANHQTVTVSFADKVRSDDSGKGIWSAWGPEINMELPTDFWYELPQSDYQAISQDDGNSSLQVRKTPNWQTGAIEQYNLFKALDSQLHGLWDKLGITDQLSKWDWCVNNITEWSLKSRVSGHSKTSYKVNAKVWLRDGSWQGNRINTESEPTELDYGNETFHLSDVLQDNGDLVYLQYAEPAGYDASHYLQHKWMNTKPDDFRPIAQNPLNNLLVSSATLGGGYLDLDGKPAFKDASYSSTDISKFYVEQGQAVAVNGLLFIKTGKSVYYDSRKIGDTKWAVKTTASTAGMAILGDGAGYELRAPRQFADGSDHGWSLNFDDLDWNLLQTDMRQQMNTWSNHNNRGYVTVNSETVNGSDLNAGEGFEFISGLSATADIGDVWHASFLARVTNGTAKAAIRTFDTSSNWRELWRGSEHQLTNKWSLVTAEYVIDGNHEHMNFDFLVEALGNAHVEITRPAIFSGDKGGTSGMPWNYHIFDHISNPTKAVDSPLVPYSIGEFNSDTGVIEGRTNADGNYLVVNVPISQRALQLYGNDTHFVLDMDVRQYGTGNDPKGKRVRLFMHDADNDSYEMVTAECPFTGDDSHFRIDFTLPKSLSHYTNVSMDLLGTKNTRDSGQYSGAIVPYSDNWSDMWTQTFESGVQGTGSTDGQYLPWQGDYTGATALDDYVFNWQARNIGDYAGNTKVDPTDDGANWVKLDYAALEVGVDVPITSTITIQNEGTEEAPVKLHINMPGDNGYIGAGTATQKVLLGNISQPDKTETQTSKVVTKADFNNDSWFSINDVKAIFKDGSFSDNPASGRMNSGWGPAGSWSSRWRLGVTNTGAYYDGIHGANAYFPWNESATNWSVRGYFQYQGGKSNGTGASMFNVQGDGELIASLQLWWWYQHDAQIRIRIGNQVFVEGDSLPDFNNYIGEMWLKRHGNHFEFVMVNNEEGGASRSWSYDIDANNTMYEADFANPKHEAHANNWYWGKWGNSNFVGGWMLDNQVWKDNVTVINDIPNTFKSGDQVVVDSGDHKSTPYLNGAVSYLLGDVGNKPLMAPVGTSYVHVQWSNWAKRPEVYATIRERFS